MSILPALKSRFASALAGLTDNPAEMLEAIRRSQDPKFGDYQANMAMALGKQLKRPPREVAAEIVAKLDVADLCETPEIAGPGFINLRVRTDWLADRLAAAMTDERLGVPKVGKPRTFVVDYSAPNVAKPMHVGHIRSTVIGGALYETLKFLGHKVISDNHIGDWGTQFGMIIYGYRNLLDAAAYAERPVDELLRVYRLVRRLMDFQASKEPAAADTQLEALSQQYPDVGAAVLAETAKLHAGDAENRRLWSEVLPVCQVEIDRIYQRLNVRFDHALGESFYEDRLASVCDELVRRGLAVESNGALCVFLEGHETPMLVRKQDGAFLYATTDLATIQYRLEQFHPDAILYVVDHRQSMHFKHLFAAAKLLGWADLELSHISFGTVLGDDGRPFKTRSGDTVGLEGLLDEAVARALKIVSDNDDAKPNGAELSAEQRQKVAETVGIAALKYADLSQNRTSDYVFSYDKMLAMTGNTATYMQYAYARVRSIFARGGVDIEALRGSTTPVRLDAPAERALAMELVRFGEALELVAADYRPNQLTAYLYDLANRYSQFFENCPVLRAETAEIKQSRLKLCDLTARTIRKGLEVLGISVVEKM